MSLKQKDQMIDKLQQRLSELKEQNDALDHDSDQWAGKRDKANDQVHNLRAEVQKLRFERDAMNEQVRRMKQQRSDTAVKIHEAIESLRKLGEENGRIAKNRPSKSHEALQKELDDIEWQIQTTSYTLQEDKELVEKVKQLETQLNVHKKLEKSSHKSLELRKKVRGLKAENQVHHEKIMQLAEKSQQIHQQMMGKIEEAKKMKKEADDLHKQFLDARQKTKPIRDEMANVHAQILHLRKEVQEQQQQKKKDNENALKQTLEELAKEKLRRGEKLSWDEFKLLEEKGMIQQDPTEDS